MLPSRVLLRAVPRTYLYDLDVHGQLFLSSTLHRTLANAFRGPFLDFFFTRLRRNDAQDDEATRWRAKGYEFLSVCQGERNFLRPDKEGCGLVFQAIEGNDLRYADTLSTAFDPSSLRVDPSSGYLFHPSPLSRRSRSRSTKAEEPAASPYGPYSLLRSSLVLERFSDSLELDDEKGGSFEWAGMRYKIGLLREGDVWRRADR
ncbi:hypothetical protein JCM8097_000810 [Rhodosporidiobolus ruineniae]